jgi:hypothetical protein
MDTPIDDVAYDGPSDDHDGEHVDDGKETKDPVDSLNEYGDDNGYSGDDDNDDGLIKASSSTNTKSKKNKKKKKKKKKRKDPPATKDESDLNNNGNDDIDKDGDNDNNNKKRRRVDDQHNKKSVPTPTSYGLYSYSMGSVFNHPRAIPYESLYKQYAIESKSKSSDLKGFVQVNPQQIDQAYMSCTKEMNYIIASGFWTEMLLSGSIEFHDGITNGMNEDDMKFMANAWTQFARDFIQRKFELGFVPVVWTKHERFVALPAVMDLTGINVWVKRNFFNQTVFVYTIRPSTETGGFDSMGATDTFLSMLNGTSTSFGMNKHGAIGEEEIISNVFTIVDTPPDIRGDIHSKVMSLVSAETYISSRLKLQMLAETARARPPYFIEDQKGEGQYKGTVSSLSEALRNNRAGGPSSSSSSSSAPPAPSIMDNASPVQLMALHLARYKSTYHSQLGHNGLAQYEAMVTEALAKGAFPTKESKMGIGECVTAPSGKTVRPATQAAVPEDIINMLIQHQTNVFLTFGIPAGLLTTDTVHARTGVNQGAQDLLQQRVKVGKMDTIAILMDVYRFIYGGEMLRRAAEKAISTPLDKHIDLTSELKFNITLRGMPSDDKIDKYYAMGFLLPAAYKRMIAAKDFINEDDLSDHPKPPQLEAPKPVAPGSTNSTKSPATKKKKKPKSATAKKKQQQKKKATKRLTPSTATGKGKK